MHIRGTPAEMAIGERRFRLGRTTAGVIDVHGRDDADLAAGLGYAHVHDRLVQMELVRLVAQGRLCECLKDDAANLAIDVFMRRMGFAADAEPDAQRLSPEARPLVEAYCAGVNEGLRRLRRPLELVLVGHRPRPWRPADVLMTAQIMSFVALAQSQQDMESLIVEALRKGVDRERLRELFHPHLDAVDDELVGLLQRVRLELPLLPAAVRGLAALPAVGASNNWALSPARSASGTALQANDPHLDCGRLPAVWYEVVQHTDHDFRLGASMPGLPGIVMGRNASVSFGFTYGYMDTSDLFVEEIRGGQVREAEGWSPLVRRTERVLRRKNAPVELTVCSTPRGLLETGGEPADGLYLSRGWSNRLTGAAASLDATARLMRARTVAEAQEAARGVTISCNWVLADREGHIGYQQSGPLPRRRHSGLHPVPGWQPERCWDGLEPPERLTAWRDPEDGVVATANDDHNAPGGPLSINLHMGSYRAQRVKDLLAARPRHTLDDMAHMQRDLYSKQAERFLAVLGPLLPESPAAHLLAAWDRRYDAASRGASLFEDVYAALMAEVFGRGLFGEAVWKFVVEETVLFAYYFHLFDDVLLDTGSPPWFGGEGREGLFRRVLRSALEGRAVESIPRWGERRRLTMENVFFQGQLPRWLGFDRGPFAVEGNRATIAQCALERHHGRPLRILPSWRYCTDLGLPEALTALAGGVSGRRFSALYDNGIADWLAGRAKTLRARHPAVAPLP
jgi:penicillin G amidase